ncbi:MAG: Pyridoxine/pyridoxamine 5-phosphate oxidase [Actinomycetia bacterium]|nr:Pyridoxine/pyridoxamine 5-phosphate oxidase [Actinomycetes bacterium]
MSEPPREQRIAALRTEYRGPLLDERDVDPDAMAQFARWFDEALAAKVLEPDSMTVATATLDGRPSARVVALRGYDERGFVFYTNDESQKGQELAVNPIAALVFHWRELERQVRASGPVTRIDDDEARAYFAGRPLKSQIGAWASQQSVVLRDRAELEARVAAAAARFGDGEIPKPPFWNGYVVRPDELELWQGRQSRLHDRVRYERTGDGAWRIERLSP